MPITRASPLPRLPVQPICLTSDPLFATIILSIHNVGTDTSMLLGSIPCSRRIVNDSRYIDMLGYSMRDRDDEYGLIRVEVYGNVCCWIVFG